MKSRTWMLRVDKVLLFVMLSVITITILVSNVL